MIEIVPNWHPLFVHFTVALFSLSVVFFVIQRPLAETDIGDNFLVFARYSLWLGVLFSVITLIAGWDAYNTVDHDTPSHAAMTEHRNWGVVTFAIFFIAAIWWAVVGKINERASIAFLLCLLVGASLLVTTGHKGSQLVFEYGLGVKSLPAKDDHKTGGGHDHSHGDSVSDDHHGNDGMPETHDDAHDHSDTGSTHDSLDSMSTGDESPADDMNMDNQIMQETPLSEKNENDAAVNNIANEDQAAVSRVTVNVVKLDDEIATADKIVEEPKIEKYQDGTIRETLPEIALDIQE